MQFGGDDIKLFLEVVGPLLTGLWWLRGTLVALNETLKALGGRVTKVEKDVDELEKWRLRYVETHPAQRIPR